MPVHEPLRIASLSLSLSFLVLASQIACAVHDVDGGVAHNSSISGSDLNDTSVDIEDVLSGEVPNPTLASCDDGSCCPAGWPVVEGDAGPNVLIGGSSSQCLIGLGEDDTLRAGSAGDFLVCGDGDDTCEGDSAADTILGGPGDDYIDGGSGDDTIECGGGNDVAHGGSGHDSILGEGGNDALHGGTGDDEIVGGTGNDVCRGDSGNDTIVPGPGRDDVDAGSGSDRVVLRNVCEVRDPGEILNGGSGLDELVTPVSTAELASIGVTVSGFETVTIDDSQLAKSECFECACEIVAGAVECCSGHGSCELVADEKESCVCDPGWAGPNCEIACLGDPDCSIEVYRTAIGGIGGMLAHGTALFSVADPLDPEGVLLELRAFLADHPTTFQLAEPTDPDAFELVPDAAPPLQAGGLTIHRFVQTYRGIGIGGPDALIHVTVTPAGAMAMSGAIAVHRSSTPEPRTPSLQRPPSRRSKRMRTGFSARASTWRGSS